MLKALWARLRDQKGFTLVETLVVVTIIGVLASVAVAGVGTTTGDSKTSACRSNVATLQAASDAYYAKNGAYAAGTTATAAIDNLVTAKLLRTAPTGDTTFTYSATTGAFSASC